MSSNLIIRHPFNKLFYFYMLRKKYRFLKNIFKFIDFVYLRKQSSYLSFFYLYSTNSIKYLVFKTLLVSLNLQTFFCNCTLIKRKLSLFKIPAFFVSRLFMCSILIIYKKENLVKSFYDCNFLFGSNDLLFKKLNILPLFIFYLNKFFYFSILNQIKSMLASRKNITLDFIFTLFYNYSLFFYFNELRCKA